jgi:hypothetical protein
MTKTIEDLFFYLVFAADLFVIGHIFLFVKNAAKYKVLWLIVFYSLFNSLFNIIPSFISPKSLYLTLVLFTCVEYLVFAMIFYDIIKHQLFRKIIIGASAFFLIVVIFSYHPDKKTFDSLPIGIETILIIIFSFYYLFEQMNNLTDSFIYNRYHFWIAIGILLYLGGSFFIYIFADKVDSKILDDYWFLTYVFYIIKNIFFAIGIANLVSESKREKIKSYSIN